MKTKMKSYKKYLASLLLALLIFTQSSLTANAITTVTFDPMEIANKIIKGFGINRDVLNSSIKSYNVAPKKELSPKVSLLFSPANPQLGERVTATATPTYFINAIDDLYFTWFLKQKGCDETGNPSAAVKARCDLDEDGDIDIEDYKIKAMRIIANDDFDWEHADYSSSDEKSFYDSAYGGEDQHGKNHYCYVQDIRSGDTKSIKCDKHLFPNAPGATTGDNKFSLGEEKFWHTDPTIPDTKNFGNTDEANVSGLGISDFTWSYTPGDKDNPGDKVGVVIEGVGVNPTQEKDSSFKTMWAAPNGMCWKQSAADISKASDLNDCLEDSLISPSDLTDSGNRLEVSLSYLPTSPINDKNVVADPAISLGDDVTVQSSINNANDNSYLLYSWEVFASDEPMPESWGNPLLKSDLPNSTQMEGLGIDTFKFKLNLHDPKKYLNIKLTVHEHAEDGPAREGHNSVLMLIKSNEKKISVFNTETSNPASPHIKMTNELCKTPLENAICPIAKDKIIGVKIPEDNLTDFLWTIDGKPFTYSECFFDNCNLSKQTNVAYFPAIKEVGDEFTIGLVALDKNTGEKVNLSRAFKVADPAIVISSVNQATCKPAQLGNYIDTNGLSWPDYSTLNFWGLSNSPIQLQANSSWFDVSPDEYIWTIDGLNITTATSPVLGYSLDQTGVLTLPGKGAGDGYSVTAQAVYAQEPAVKAALKKYWDVSYDQFYEKNIYKNVIITMQEGSTLISSTQPKKILATLYTSIPSYLTFLLRIALTMFVILFSSQLILLFFPNIKKEIK